MRYWFALSLAAALLIGMIGVGLTTSGRPFTGLSMAAFSIGTAHLNWVHRHD